MAICDRYTGVGADGWMLLDRTRRRHGFRRHRSGSSIPMAASPNFPATARVCALRCWRETIPARTEFRIRTGAGIKDLRIVSARERPRFEFEMNMGEVARGGTARERCRGATR